MIPILKGIWTRAGLATAGSAEACALAALPDLELQPANRRSSDAAPTKALRVAATRVRDVRSRIPLMGRTSARDRGLPSCGELRCLRPSRIRVESTRGIPRSPGIAPG